MTTLGDVIYGGASGAPTRLAGNTTTTPQFLQSVGTGAASAAPAWISSTGTGSVVLSSTPTITTAIYMSGVLPSVTTPDTTGSNSLALRIATGDVDTSGTTGNITVDPGAGTLGASNGSVSIGTTNANAVTIGRSTKTTTINGGTVHAAGTSSLAPLTFTSGTNLATPAAGAVEYDGTVMWSTPNTNLGRGSIPTAVYTTGTGTSLTLNTETTLQPLFPAANDTITLPIGIYHVDMAISAVRGTTDTTSAQLQLNILGSGNAAGTFHGIAVGSAVNGGAANSYAISNASIATSQNITPASTTAGGRYNSVVSGLLKVTTQGTIVPQYALSANLTTAGTQTNPAVLNHMIIQVLNSSGTANFNGGWS